jgi:glycosyltransferase involved in cell wall biosynthesis
MESRFVGAARMMRGGEEWPFVGVVIPCRNEAGFIGACLDSILGGDYPADRMEVIVADGMSLDGTREMVAQYASRDARVRMVDNPERITPVALNRAIAATRGEITVRFDAHAAMPGDYISKCVEVLERSGADNVGGAMRTVVRSEPGQDGGVFAGPIVAALSHRFGVGNSAFRTGCVVRPLPQPVALSADGEGTRSILSRLFKTRAPLRSRVVKTRNRSLTVTARKNKRSILSRLVVHASVMPIEVDTVFGGCWRREVFTRIGGFNEKLVRGQDMEFNVRLRRAGGRILMDPQIVCDYYPRTSFGAFWSHNFSNGVWAVLPFAWSRVVPVRWRHLAPLALVVTMTLALVMMVITGRAWPIWIALGYGAANLAASVHVAFSRRVETRSTGSRQVSYLMLMPVTFAALHLAYGIGSLWGCFKLMVQVSRRVSVRLMRDWNNRSRRALLRVGSKKRSQAVTAR